jgi:hypothetical protein
MGCELSVGIFTWTINRGFNVFWRLTFKTKPSWMTAKVICVLPYLEKRTNLVHNFFLICLLLFSTCFGQLCAHHQEKIRTYATPGICHYVWMTVWYAGRNSAMHTRQSSIYSDKYQASHRYGIFSWWWAHSCPKHVEKSNKHIKKNCAPSWFFLQDYTRLHGQQNITLCVAFNFVQLN